MAKKGRNGLRDTYYIANPRLHVPRITTPRPIRLTPLQLVEDRRTWHPDGRIHRPIRMTTTQRPRLKPVAFSAPKFKNTLPTKIGFDVPRKVAICVRRKQRKEVLHALKKTGRSGGGRKKARRNIHSDIHC